MYTKDQIRKVREDGNLQQTIELVVHDLQKKGKDWVGTCPICSSKKFYFVPSKGTKPTLYKCHRCDDFGGTDPIGFIMKSTGAEFLEAVQKVADVSNIFLETGPRTKPERKQPLKGSFCDSQLKESGIPEQSVKIRRKSGTVDSNLIEVDEFMPGSKGQFNEAGAGDDMIINYLDLDYKPVLYRTKKSTREQVFYRVRFKNPSLHKDRGGSPMKYWQPFDSGVHVFIPEELRSLFWKGAKIDTLHFEEGEKKAKKKSLHGMPAIGFMGINSIVSNGELPADIIRIIETCKVKNVVFNLDSDWRDIRVKKNVSADQRPRSFFTAISKFRDYFRDLSLQGSYLNIYVGSIHKELSEQGPLFDCKGSDDLLAGPLKSKENELLNDFKTAMIHKDKCGKYIQLFEISESTPYNIKELLHIQNVKAFAKHHFDELSKYPKFKFGKTEYKYNEDGSIELAQPLLPREMFWKANFIRRGGETVKEYVFRYVGLVNFLHSRGFNKYYFGGKNNYTYVYKTNNVLTEMEPNQIRDYVKNFVEDASLTEDILELIYRGGDQYLSERKLYNMRFRNFTFFQPEDGLQYFYFRSESEKGEEFYAWKVTSNQIEKIPFANLNHIVWSDKINNVGVELHDLPYYEIKTDKAGNLRVHFSKDAENCQFLVFLSLTSIFNHESRKREYVQKSWKKKLDLLTEEERIEHDRHFLAKITAIGYLLHDYRDSSVLKAVVAMDGRQSEVGASNGRSGKSLMGMILREVIPTVIINGKRPKIHENQFLFSKVDERTRMIFVDDCTVNFNFEYFFPPITGLITVNQKGKDEYDIPISKAPKFYFNTNHAFNGEGTSFNDRQHVIVFSDYFNDIHKPIIEFGNRFIEDWDNEQYSYFYNCVAQFLRTYFQFKKQFTGPVPAPMEGVKLRKLRQLMGEDFLAWASSYFAKGNHLNEEVSRTDAFDDCKKSSGNLARYLNAHGFKKKLLAYCDYTGCIFNPHKPKLDSNKKIIAATGGEDKRGGVEYITVAEASIHKSEFNDQGPDEDQPF